MLLVFLGFSINSCVESFEIEDGTFEDLLVVEATITNELKRQEVQLFRTYGLKEREPLAVTNAIVTVSYDQNQYAFEETTPGIYLSSTEFRAEPEREYRLEILTAEGKSYVSEPTQLTPAAEMNLEAQPMIHEGMEGVALLIDSYNPQGNSNYYRYQYQETFKIVSPLESPYDLIFIDGQAELRPKGDKEEKTCYRTETSNELLLTTTNNLREDRLENYQFKFLERLDSRIAHRYSVLVTQQVLSAEAYTFYRTLEKFSGSTSLFSQNQPGFIPGNISPVEDQEDKVIGFFNVSSVVHQRIFFNFTDFFNIAEGFPRPFAGTCAVSRPEWPTVMYLLMDGTVKYLGPASWPDEEGFGPYRVAPPECIDCTFLGSNEPPEFWVE